MEPQVRYQITDTIAQGDFAIVYRAVDNELGREVAIKQIHQQYLADPQKLERYWQEAQLLANLENPYIMTIYDIVRERGWLILELMQGSLQQKLAGNPIDLEDLRLTMTYILHALHFLHQNGIVHGDVKPGNLLLDKNHRVKLGDFGIARRLSGDDGSVVKGTTKYMAPEVVSDQFGPVGPASDLYSLGFASYELMCGNHFDTLFPGLNMFGRDQQIAWMMWHSALDRRLPEISRVLEGVPEDLAHVIEKLVEKDPSKRYQSAEKAILELRAGGDGGDATMTQGEKEAAEQEEKKAKRKRVLSIAALAGSVLLSIGVLFGESFFSSGSDPDEKIAPSGPREGTITGIYPDRSMLELDPGDGNEKFSLTVNQDIDRIMLNDAKAHFADLQENDQITIARLSTQDGKEFKEITATRQLATGLQSQIAAIDYRTAMLTLAQGGPDGGPLAMYVPSNIEIVFNGSPEIDGRAVRLGDLKQGDRVTVEHVMEDKREAATSITALRELSISGFLVNIDTDKRTVTMRTGSQATAPKKTLKVSPQCEFMLNDLKVLAAGKVVTLGDLKAEDRVDIDHDAQILRIDAHREFSATGAVTNVDYDARRITVRLSDQPSPVEFTLDKNCKINLDESGTPVLLTSVRNSDTVTISHNSANLVNAIGKAVSLVPKPDPGRWAIVIGQQQYDDGRMASLQHTASAAQAVHDTLLARYRVSKDQVMFELDSTRLRLDQEIPTFIARIGPADQLLVYFVGHGYLDESGIAQLAAKEFDVSRMRDTGLSLRWLVTQLESATVPETTLLLDTCHSGTGNDLKSQPSTQNLVATLKDGPTRPVSTSITVIASCSDNQRGLVSKDNVGVFSEAVCSALSGQADTDRDHRVDTDELFGHLTSTMSGLSAKARGTQTPARFIPDANPPRLTPQTKEAVNRLLGFLRASRFDDSITGIYTTSRRLQQDQPDVRMAYALVLLKHNRTRDSQPAFEAVRASNSDTLLPYHALAWQYFMQKKYEKGLEDLTQLVANLPEPDEQNGYDLYSKHVLEMAGIMSMFAYKAAERPVESDVLAPLNQAVQGDQARALFLNGVNHVNTAVKELDEKIQAAPTADEKESLERNRRRLTYYGSFDYDIAADHLRKRLED